MYHLNHACQTAIRFQEMLAPHCDRIHIAGSVRRRQHQVKDIEIVCQPKKEFQATDLFGGGQHVISKDFTEALMQITGKVVKGNVNGRYMQIITSSRICPGIKLDLFMPDSADYFRQLVIRTGSKEYVHHIIAGGWVHKGWCGVKDVGLRRMEDCTRRIVAGGKTVWNLWNKDGEKPPAWESEEEFYQWIGVSYHPPHEREFKNTLNPVQ